MMKIHLWSNAWQSKELFITRPLVIEICRDFYAMLTQRISNAIGEMGDN